MLVLAGPKNPASSPEDLETDSYVLLARKLIERGVITGAVFVYNDPAQPGPAEFDITPNIKGYFFSYAKKFITRYNFWGVFVRGNWQEHKDLFLKLSFRRSFFYAADNKFLPAHINGNKFDTILVDDNYQKRVVRQNCPEARPVVFDKPVSERIFYPRPVKKTYDLCYIANFRQWKNHNMLFRALRSLKFRGYNLKIALAGVVRPNERELQTMLFKYDVNARVFEKVNQAKVAHVLRQSKFSIQLGELDANPRSMTESLACGVPVLVNRKLEGGLHLVNKQTGAKTSLAKLDKGIEQMLENYDNYDAYGYFRENLRSGDIVERCFNKK